MSARVPLFAAPWSHAAHYAGAGTCTLCAEHRTDTLSLEDGVEVSIACGSCRSPSASPAGEAQAVSCRHCGADVGLLRPPGRPRACFVCVAAGCVRFTHQTEVEPVSWDESDPAELFPQNGPTPAATGPVSPAIVSSTGPQDRRSKEKQRRKQLRRAAAAAEEEDVAVDEGERRALALTPPIAYWGENSGWLVCCAAFMVYVGHWRRKDFDAHAHASGEGGKSLFERAVDDTLGPAWNTWAPDLELAKMFRCRRCTTLRGALDLPP